MKEIPLSKGRFAIVDDEDYNKVINYKWYYKISSSGTEYAYTNINKKWIYLHQFIIGKHDLHTDHINHNGLDNRKDNLRICSPRANNNNRGKRKAKYTGVTKIYNTWISKIYYLGENLELGRHQTPQQASQYYEDAYDFFENLDSILDGTYNINNFEEEDVNYYFTPVYRRR